MKLLLLTCILTAISIGSTVFAAVEYTPIVSIPRINGNEFSTKEYIQAIYFLAIAAAALMAVVKIIYGGVQYMLDGIVTHKEQAKKEIQGALFGLLIVLSAVLLLNTINPNLTKLNIFADAPSLEDINASKTNVGKPACVIDSTSQACCASRGGVFSLLSGIKKCSVGATIPILEDNTLQAQIICENTMHGVWSSDTKECKATTNREIVIPPQHQTIEDKRYYCEANNGYIDESTQKCLSLSGSN